MDISIRRNDKIAGAIAKLSFAIHAALDAGAVIAFSAMAIYPPTLPNQRYRRTNNLRQKLAIVKPGPNQRLVINTASYAAAVYGPNQANIHRGRWVSIDQAMALARQEAYDVLREKLP